MYDIEKAWRKLKTSVEKTMPTTSLNAPTLRTGQATQGACTYTTIQLVPLLNRGSEPPQETPMRPNGTYASQNRFQTQRSLESPTEPAYGVTFGLSDYMSTCSSIAGWLVGRRSEAMEEAKVKQPHSSSRRSLAFGTQWVDIYAPRAEANWPKSGWPYIPTFAFLDSGSRGNVNSVSKDFLVEQLRISYKPTDHKIRGHEISFTPLGVTNIKFHPVDTNARGESKADIAVTLSFYVHTRTIYLARFFLDATIWRVEKVKAG